MIFFHQSLGTVVISYSKCFTCGIYYYAILGKELGLMAFLATETSGWGGC